MFVTFFSNARLMGCEVTCCNTYVLKIDTWEAEVKTMWADIITIKTRRQSSCFSIVS